MRFLLSLCIASVVCAPSATAQTEAEATGVEATVATAAAPQPLPASARSLSHVLMVAESTTDNVIVLDPDTGDLLSSAFLTSTADLTTPINVIPDLDGDGVLVCDQIKDAVYRFSSSGEPEGLFAPAGGANPEILDNVRGCATRGDTLFVTSASGPNADAIAMFDATGAYIGNFIAPGAGGMQSPFDLLFRDNDVLVSAINSDNVLRFGSDGAFLDVFASPIAFPEQLHETASGTILVADFSTSDQIYEYAADGTPVGSYSFSGISGFRGVYELPSGSLLLTTGGGVYEVQRNGTVVRQIVSGVSARFIEQVPAGFIVAGEASPSHTAVLRVVGANPFKTETTLELIVDRAQAVRVEVFDVMGRQVATLYQGTLGAGTAQVLTLRESTLAPGVYAVRATGETFSATRQVSHVH